MIPVYLHGHGGKSGLNYERFESEIGNICEQHRCQGRALVFALLLYDFMSPGVGQVLDDRHYWLALDRAAGQTISVFSIHTPTWLFERNREQTLESIRGADPGKPAQHIIDKYFPLDGELPIPGIVFFQVEEGQIIDAYLVKIRSRGAEHIFNEILEIITTASDSLRDVLPENKGNSSELFNLVVRDIKNRELGVMLKMAKKRITGLREFLLAFVR